ncbi:hypothetical protein Pla22_41340 [Rubripirellula amarantea]|uniref:Protein SlyX n=1 Tax=Rubripirellula amarantea TaxID=2527999 RepID=A0A5C5WL49_9BACT|nr:SlyX family protein [Rubripirellula amarantea]TWT51357.1 hypothetical protein Pla22_41340 [Rubripirellula amarantea]
MDEDRITKLEVSVGHLQRLFDQLNEVVTEQAMRADRMYRKISELERQLKESKDKTPDSPPSLEDEKPPHY